ncbi:Inorganic phosphate transporter [Datura stramonium]|uniref:Inorganic phosphate transporter n=1 Tax=Datura stramonium TaxID=4076 RepID=A0ABS8SJP0_DATST|nr:Inorganic phosphate transporter [Datura stramonium]
MSSSSATASLIGTMSTWFLLDIAFYSQNLTQKDIFPVMGLTSKANTVSALKEMFETSRAMFVIALLGTFPGYWFTVFFIEKMGSYSHKDEIHLPRIECGFWKGGGTIGAFGIQQYTQDGNVHKIKKAMILLAVTNMVGFCCTFLVTETKGLSLEEISGEDGRQNETKMKTSKPDSGHQDDGWE